MVSKHFSHHHPLVFHQVHQGSQIHCSGCQSPASGNIYVCWQCSYFLHEQCFRAVRSLHHPSHPLHPLSLVPFPTHPSSSFLCNSCNLAGHGFSYTCSHCDFDIHVHCALTPDPNPQNINNPIYPPPFPTYPPQSATIPNHTQTTKNNPSPNTTAPNQTHTYTPHQHNPPLGYPQPNATPQSFTPTTDPPPPVPPQISQPPINIIKHFSHPHVLKQMELDDETSKLCSACQLKLSGSAYCCAELYCTFSLHKACFDSPREVPHKSHPHHPLTLLPATPYSNGSFTCDACRKGGKAFVYTCSTCSYDLHIDCIRWPETLTRPDHKHSLALYYESPFAAESGEAIFICSACGEAADDKAWVYYCRECDFGTHLECVNSEIKPQSVAGGSGGDVANIQDELFRFQQQKMNLDFQMQMAKQQAEFMTSIANSWKNFF